MAPSKTIYLSLGSNLGNRLNNLQRAVFLLSKSLGNVIEISHVYESPSWGFEGSDFLNACISVDTDKVPEKALSLILDIETALGRNRLPTDGYRSRTIDIDILYFENEVIETNELNIPHSHLEKRRFVLKPLADIAPQFYHPILKKDTRNLLQQCADKIKLQKTVYVLYKSREQLFSQLHFMAIEGNIGVGKTTLAKKIANDFTAKLILERFADNPFLPKFYEDQARFAFPLEMSFLADRYQQFTDDTSQFDLFKKFMVSDYDIFKSLIFAKITLQNEEYLLYRKLFNLMYKEVKKPDVYIYLFQPTDNLIRNIRKRGRSYEQEIQPDYLNKINRGYMDFIKGQAHHSSVLIDMTHLDFVDRLEDYQYILDQIQEHIVGR